MAARQLDRAAWVAAALELWAESGLEKVAVEPLAARLGATKGSFYWHFASRAELVAAALEHWEREATQDVIATVQTVQGADRAERLILEAFTTHEIDVAEWMILSAADDPAVAPVVDRVHKARLAYLRQLFGAAGLTPARARARAQIAYATYLGHLSLMVSSPGLPVHEQRAFRRELAALLTQP